MFSWINAVFCSTELNLILRFSISSLALSSSAFFASSCLLRFSISFLELSFCISSALKLPLTWFLFSSISLICLSISVVSALSLSYIILISDNFCFAWLRFICSVLTAKDTSLLALLSASISSLIDAILALLSAILVLSSVDDLLSSDTDFLSSSISLLLPRRLLEFLKAPPVIEPPGLSCSPSSVTILNEYLYFLAITRAFSILSTTRIRPSRYLASPSYSKDTLTRLLATPTTPFSLIQLSFSNVFLEWIALSGKNVARPSLFTLR